MAGYKKELRKRLEALKSKRDALKKAIKEKKKILDSFKPEEHEKDRAEYLKNYKVVYDTILDIIQKKTKDIADEVTELESFERKKRFGRWGKWWNLWIFGWIAAGLAALLEILWALFRGLLQTLNDPEKMLVILEKVIDKLSDRLI